MNDEKKKPLSIFGLASGESLFGLSTRKGVTAGGVTASPKKAIPLCCQQLIASKPANRELPAQAECKAAESAANVDTVTKTMQEKLAMVTEKLQKRAEEAAQAAPKVSDRAGAVAPKVSGRAGTAAPKVSGRAGTAAPAGPKAAEPVAKGKRQEERAKVLPKAKPVVHARGKPESEGKQNVKGGAKKTGRELLKKGRELKRAQRDESTEKKGEKERIWAPSQIWTFSLVYNGPRENEGGIEQEVDVSKCGQNDEDNLRQVCDGFSAPIEDGDAATLVEFAGDDAEQGTEKNGTEMREEKTNDDKGDMQNERQHVNVSDVNTKSKKYCTEQVLGEHEQGNASDACAEAKRDDVDAVWGKQRQGNVSDVNPESKKYFASQVQGEQTQGNVSDTCAESKKYFASQVQGEQTQGNVSDTCAEGKLTHASDAVSDATREKISGVPEEDKNETPSGCEQLNANTDQARSTSENHQSRDEPVEEGIRWVPRAAHSQKGTVVRGQNCPNDVPQHGSGQAFSAKQREQSTREPNPGTQRKGTTTHFNVDPTAFIASKITTSQSDSSLGKRSKEIPTCDFTELRTKTAVERLIGRLTNTEIAPAVAKGKPERFIPPFFQQRSEPTEEADSLLPMNEFEKDLFVEPKKRKKKPMAAARILGISQRSIRQKLEQGQTKPKSKALRHAANPIDVDTSSSYDDDDEIDTDFEAALAMAVQQEVTPMKKSRSVEMNPIPFNPGHPKKATKKRKQEQLRTISFTMRSRALSKAEELEFTNTCSSAAPNWSNVSQRAKNDQTDRTIHFTCKACGLSSLKFTNDPAANLHALCETPERTITFTNKTSNVTQIAFTDKRASLLEHIKATYRAIADANAPEPALLPDPSGLDSQFIVTPKRLHH